MQLQRVSVLLQNVIRPGAVVLLAGALPFVGVFFLACYGIALVEYLEQWSSILIGMLLVFGCGTLCGIALLPTHAVSLMAGWFLGSFFGSIVALFAVTFGAALGFVGGKHLVGTSLAQAIEQDSKWNRLYFIILKRTPLQCIALVSLMRISPLAPFAATNIAFASIHLPFLPFLVGTLLGLAPRVVLVVILGSSLAKFEWSNPNTPELAAFGTVITVATILMIGWYAKKKLRELALEQEVLSH